MKKSAVFSIFAIAASVALAQFRPGEGVANDHATGESAQDVVFVQRGGGNPYGYRSYDMALGLTFLPWAVPNFESSVKGFRLNLGWGHYAGTYGLDLHRQKQSLPLLSRKHSRASDRPHQLHFALERSADWSPQLRN